MPHQFSQLTIMNAALTAVGLDEIVSENDGTPEFRAMVRNWPGIVEAELEAGRYDFSIAQETLLSRIDGKFGKADGYLIPLAALAVRNLWVATDTTRDFVDWYSDGTAVYLDSTTGCVIEYLTVPDPAVWSANFSLGVQHKLEAVLYRMTLDGREAQQAEMLALSAFETARTVASKNRAARPLIRQSAYAAARFGRG